ncbi:MAG: radical SAM family heme chaperone HemW [Ignavibacteria bacterium]|nr:radical SAM family heme chaperone HemW [Ignavibacteria bacterium]
MKPLSIYIHIPFCEHKCIYCDFYSLINHSNLENFFNCLKKEIQHFKDDYSIENIIETIYFGGGTPSLVEPKYIEEILTELRNNYKVSDTPEITLETNPGTVTKSKLEELKSIGINRLSIGVQSFDEDDLKFLTRIHSKQQAIDCIKWSEEAGYKNISIDLIFSIPSQSQVVWKENLKLAVEMPIQHISAYSLTLERGTPLYFQVTKGITSLKSIEHDSENYELTMEFLEQNGFNQYEVSNFAKSGFECKHNLNYWNHKNYLGFGPSAHSYYNNRRWWNYTALSRYLEEIKTNSCAIMSEEFLNPTELYNERIFLGLRSKGLDLKKLEEEFNIPIKSMIDERFLNDLLKNDFIKLENQVLRLTKKGYLLCDEICEQLMI